MKSNKTTRTTAVPSQPIEARHNARPLRRRQSDRINREDATLRGSWLHNPSNTPADQDWSDPDRDLGGIESDGCRGSWSYGELAEAPEKPGPRFHTPVWVRDRDLRYKFGERLLRMYTKNHPTLKKYIRSKAATETQILFDYFVDHLEYAELYDKHRKPTTEVYDVSTKDAKTLQEAIEFAAEKNGTFAAFSEDGNTPWVIDGKTAKVTPSWFDNVEHRFKVVSARKVNAETFRVELHNEVDEQYYLPEKLVPSEKSARLLQRYIADLVTVGYSLMKIAKRTESDRKAARLAREEEEEREIARVKLGKGVNPHQWAHSNTISDESRSLTPAMILHIEYKRLAALEARLKREGSPKEAKDLDGENAYREFLKLTKVDEAVARFSRPWQPAVVESAPAARKLYVAPAVRHEQFRSSLLELLAGVVKGQRPNHEWQVPRLVEAA